MTHVDYLSRNPTDDECNLKVCALKIINIKRISNMKTLREFWNSNAFYRGVLNDPDSY